MKLPVGFLLVLCLFFVTFYANATVPTNQNTQEEYESSVLAPNKMVVVVLLMDNGDDLQVVSTIYTSLMSAEKVAKLLNVELVANDEVNDDIFVFSIKSEEQKSLAMKMFDEEGYELAANRILDVNEGHNYNALNVKSLDDGTYIFQITDESGAEKTQSVTIKRD